MRTVLLANGRLGYEVGRYLQERDDLVGLVLHPVERRRMGEDLEGLEAPKWTWPDGLADVRALAPECLLSVLFGYLIPAEWLELPSWRSLNLHPALLPWNRGANPNVWPLVDESPAGVTLHVMDARIDTGPLMHQIGVPAYPDDTAETLGRIRPT